MAMHSDLKDKKINKYSTRWIYVVGFQENNRNNSVMFPVYSLKNTFMFNQEEQLKPDMHKSGFAWLKKHIRPTSECSGGGKKKTNKCFETASFFRFTSTKKKPHTTRRC